MIEERPYYLPSSDYYNRRYRAQAGNTRVVQPHVVAAIVLKELAIADTAHPYFRTWFVKFIIDNFEAFRQLQDEPIRTLRDLRQEELGGYDFVELVRTLQRLAASAS